MLLPLGLHADPKSCSALANQQLFYLGWEALGLKAQLQRHTGPGGIILVSAGYGREAL